MSRLILKQHGMNRLLETSPLAIGQSVAALRDAPVINWLKLRYELGFASMITNWLPVPAEEWERTAIAEAEEYDAEMAETLH